MAEPAAVEQQKDSPRRFGSLAATLALAFVLLSVGSLLISGSLMLVSAIRTQQLVISNNQQLIARDAARSVNDFVEEKFRLMETAIWFGDPVTSSAQAQTQILESMLGFQPAFRQLVLFDRANHELARVSQLSRAASELEVQTPGGATLAWIQRGKRYISQVYIDEPTSEPMAIIAVPVMSIFGDFLGTLAAEVKLKFLWDLVDQIKVGRGGLVYVVDKQGDLLAFHDSAQVLKGENVRDLKPVAMFLRNPSSMYPTRTSIYRGISGEMVVGTYVPLPAPDWAVVIELPWAEAYREILRDVFISLGIVLTVAAGAGLLGVHVSRRLSVPLVKLMKTADRITSGQMSLQAEVTGPREVASLAQAFNSMTAQLRRTFEGLEQQVVERTREVQEALNFQERIVAVSSSGILAYDSSGQCVLANEAAARMINASVDQVLAQNFHRIQSWKESGLYEAALEVFKTGSEREKDVHLISTFGREAWLNCRFTTFEYGGQHHLLLTINDMSERVKTEQEIRDLNKRLKAQADNLAAANKELEAFNYTVSHDLRTPLRAIDGFTRILADEYASSLDAEAKRVCAVVTGETRRMGLLIDDLLAFSRAGRFKMNPLPLDMNEMASSAFEQVVAPETGRNIEFRIGQLPPVVGDPALIKQVWTNLLSNAVKFSSRKKRARIVIGGHQIDEETVFFVRDNGAGFSMKYSDKLFQVFQRLHGESEFEGSGVGLAIVQRIISRHGGRTWAEGKTNQGATFFFSLPRQAQEPGR
jgi:PAS domain S-box-containing protein